MATRNIDNILPVQWRVEYRPPGGNWAVLVSDAAYPSPYAGDTKIRRSYNSPQGALGTWQIRVIFQPVETRVRLEGPDTTMYYETVTEQETVTSIKSRKLILTNEIVISGKATSTYKRGVYVKLPKPGPWDLKLVRNTADSTSSYLVNKTYWDTLKETVEAKLSYPNSAYVALSFDAEQFSSIPSRAYHVYGILCQVPNGYDPMGRTYPATWDGTFVEKWTNNPAWIYYDIITKDRYGLGDLVDASLVDKWGLYKIAQYCDQLVPSGYGYLEPRFTCNTYIQTREDAYKLLSSLASVFRGMSYWSSSHIATVADMPADPVALFTNANVINGEFNYSGSALSTRFTAALVTWNNPQNMYQQEVEYVEGDAADIAKYGLITAEVVAYGCTSRGQAHRYGKWVLYTNNIETDLCSFGTGLEGTTCYPGAISQVADTLRSGDRIGGRVQTATTTSVTLDSTVTLASGLTYTLTVVLPSGAVISKTVTNAPGATQTLNLASPLTEAPQKDAVWVLASANLNPQTFRVLTVSEKDATTLDITALAHDPNKFDKIEYNLVFDEIKTSVISTEGPALPTDLKATDTLYLQGPGIIGVKMHISWDATGSRYTVMWRKGSDNYESQTVLTNSLDVAPVEEGPYTIRVQATDTLGRPSGWQTLEYTVLGKQAPPAQPKDFKAVITLSGIALEWTANTDLDLKEYEITVNGDSKRLAANQTLYPFPAAGTTTYALRAVDTSGNFSDPAITSVTLVAPGAPEVHYAFDGPNVTLTLGTPTSQLPLDHYVLSYGNTFEGSTLIGDIYATTFTTRVDWAGARNFYVRAADIANNTGDPGLVTVVVVAPPAPVVTSQVIDNNVLLYWDCGVGSLPIDTFGIRRGSTWDSAEIIGDKSGSFTAIFETTGGIYTYLVAARDTAGNYGPAAANTVTVAQPPDYVLRADIDAELANVGGTLLYTRLSRTLDSALLENGAIQLPVNLTETFSEHFTAHSWTAPQSQVNAGYPYYAQPNAASGYYEEVIDYGAILASSKITVTPTGTTLYGTVAVSVLISTKLNSGDAWTDFNMSEVYATNYRYIRVRVTVTGTASMYQLTGLNIRLDSKTITDSGMVTCSASDAGGTQVLFGRSFIDITSIQVTASGTSPVYALYDFADTGNPMGFKVLLFNLSGVRVSGSASWAVEGY